MDDIEEKRVYGDKAGRTVVYVAAGSGLARVEVADDRVGGVGLAHRCVARDVAADGRLAVATDEDVLLADAADAAGDGDPAFDPAGFGPATAVDLGDGLLAADPDGRVARRGDGGWTTVGAVGEVRAIAGDLVAAADGVYRISGDDLVYAGLDDARDVSARGQPLAATGAGLYALGNGWMDELDGAFEVASADGAPGARAHAATADALYERTGDEWHERAVPVGEPVVGVAYAGAVYAVTAEGTFLADAGEGWRTRALGLADVRGIAIP